MLGFKLYKNNNLKIEKNSIAYSKKNDRILFELDNNIFKVLLDNNDFEIEKETIENIFKLGKRNCSLYLKDQDLLLPITVESFNMNHVGNRYIVNYQLETDDEQTTIEIIL